jgi:hypothetical protein
MQDIFATYTLKVTSSSYLLTPWYRGLLEKLTGSLLKIGLPFILNL